MIHVVLPHHLQTLARTGRTVDLQIKSAVSLGAVLDSLEAAYPMLRGTVRDQITGQRRPFIRFFACGQDLSLQDWNETLPPEVADGREPLRIVGAMAGG